MGNKSKKEELTLHTAYLFSLERLRELCPEGVARYETTKGLSAERNEIQKSRR